MPKIKHPKDVARLTGGILQSESFSMGTNGERNDSQASMTYLLQSQDGLPLGSQGETTGYAKIVDKSGTSPKGSGRLYPKFAPSDDCALITRQVATYQTDKLLGLNTVSEERYGRDKNGNIIGVSIQADGCNVLSNRGILQVDCSDPRIQRGLSDLQASDFITGQTDRHAGNIFIDPTTGKVTGIDNDLSFPSRHYNDFSGETMERFTGIPKFLHRETAQQIAAVDPEALRTLLSTPPPDGGPSPLPKASIDAAVDRLKVLQAELKPGGSVTVVDAFDKTTYQASLNDAHHALRTEQQKWIDVANSTAIPGQKTRYVVPPGPLNDQQLAAMSPEEREKLYSRVIESYDTVTKTSYLATVELEMAKNRALAGYKELPVHTQARSADRSAALEQKLGAAYPEMPKHQQKAIDKDIAALNKLESQYDTKMKHLSHPSAVDRLKGILKGMSPVMHMKQVHANDLAQEIQKARTSLEQQADEALLLKAQKTWMRPLDETRSMGSASHSEVSASPPIAKTSPTLQNPNSTHQDHPDNVRSHLHDHTAPKPAKLGEKQGKDHTHTVKEDTGLEPHHDDPTRKRVKVSLD